MKQLIKYEVKNSLGNIFAIIFGIVFPIFMTILFYSIYTTSVPKEAIEVFTTQLFVTNMLMAPLALLFIGFSAMFSQEIEKDVTTRMVLFGFSEDKQMRAKFIAQFIVLLVALTLYCAVVIPVLKINAPTAFALIILALAILVLSFFFFVLAYAIAITARKFSITYGITMSFYFAVMVLSGMMGVQYDQLPKFVQPIANFLPTTHIARDIPKMWQVSTYNLMPMIQSFLAFGAVSGIIYILAIQSKKRRIG